MPGTRQMGLRQTAILRKSFDSEACFSTVATYSSLYFALILWQTSGIQADKCHLETIRKFQELISGFFSNI